MRCVCSIVHTAVNHQLQQLQQEGEWDDVAFLLFLLLLLLLLPYTIIVAIAASSSSYQAAATPKSPEFTHENGGRPAQGGGTKCCSRSRNRIVATQSNVSALQPRRSSEVMGWHVSASKHTAASVMVRVFEITTFDVELS